MKYPFLFIFSLLIFQLSAQDKKAVIEIDNNDDFSGFSLLDSSVLSNYNLFFTGEDHRYLISNSKLEFKMFKYLHKTAGVRTFIAEFGPSLGYFMKRFICQGDTIAREVLRKYSYKEYFELYENLHNFYDSLPEGEKFDVVSVDIEREDVFAIKRMDLLLPADKMAHDSIKIHTDALKAVAEYFDITKEQYRLENEEKEDEEEREKTDTVKRHAKSYLNAWETIAMIRENYAKFKPLYKDFLGDGFDAFEESMKWVDEHNQWAELNEAGLAQAYILREGKMEKNILQLFAQNPGTKAYGQFGRCHTQQMRESEECLYYYFNSLATRLNAGSHPQLAGKVFSCPVFYPYITDFIDDKVVMNKGLAQFINNAEEGKVTLFLLDSNSKAYPSLAQRFDAIIINNTQEESSENKPDEDTGEDDYTIRKEKKNQSSLLLDVGNKGYSLNSLSNTLGVSFTSPLFYGLTLTVFENKSLYVNNRFELLVQQNQKINDSTTASLRGYSIQACLGIDLAGSRNFDFAPWVSLGFDRLTLETNETYTDETRKDLFGSNRQSQYHNPAFNMGLGTDIRVHLGAFSFGVFGGYQFDLSNKNWRTNNSTNKSVPKFSASSYTVGFSIGINY